MYLLGAVGFFLALMISVVLHEAGHFVTARRYGMKATQFFAGFGPTVFSWRRGETEYGIKAIPAGGFVKIVGMTPLEEVAPGDEARAFYRQPTGRKVVVLAAGSTMHFVIAVLLVFGAVFAIGLPAEASPRIGRVTACVADDPAQGAPAGASDACQAPGSRPSPALAAGLQPGDVVRAVDGRPTDDVRAFVSAVRDKPGQPVVLTIERAGQVLEVPVTPASLQRRPLEGEGALAPAGAIGVVPQVVQVTQRQGFVDSIESGGQVLKAYLIGIKVTVTEKLGTVTKLFSPDRDPEGFIGVVGATRISGEVIASEESASFKTFSFVLLVAGLNLFVGLFNLLPLLPLDGGHIAVAVFEGTRDRIRRLRGYRGPRQVVDYNKLAPLTYAVAGVFAVFTLVLVGADIVNPIRLG